MLRPFNLRGLRSDAAEIVYLSPDFIARQGLKTFKRGDLAFARVGDVGCGVVIQAEVTISPNVIIASLKQGTINPFFATVFFNTRFGRLQLEGAIKAVAQPTISTEIIKELRLPVFSDAFQMAIQQSFINSEQLQNESKRLSTQAEQTLLRALDLVGWQPPEPLTYQRKASDAFAAERFDAEYFHPSKQAALNLLASFPGITVGEMFRPIRDLWQPDTACATQLVRNYDLTDALSPFIDATKHPILPEEISSTKKRFQKGDIIVSRLRSYLKEIAVVLDESDLPMVGSTEFIVLRPKRQSIRIEVLLVYLRSMLPQLIFKWSQDGSNHPRFDEKELLNLRVPDVIRSHEEEIFAMVHSAIGARKQAHALLERAKQAVEVAIEECEAAGLEILNGGI